MKLYLWEFVEFRFNWWLFNEKSIELFLHDFLLFLLFFFLTTILIILIIFFLFYYIFYVLNLTFFLLCVLKDTDYFILLSIKIKKKNKKKDKKLSWKWNWIGTRRIYVQEFQVSNKFQRIYEFYVIRYRATLFCCAIFERRSHITFLPSVKDSTQYLSLHRRRSRKEKKTQYSFFVKY